MPHKLPISITLFVLLAAASWVKIEKKSHERRVATLAEARLGEKLFGDSSLSAKKTLACSSCHDPAHAFAQHIPVPLVYDRRIGTRNVPSLLDLPYFTRFFWDGREEKRDKASIAAFTNEAEMAQPDMDNVIEAVKKNSATYREQFKAAFGDERVDQARIALAILTYLTSITTGRSRYDVFIGGDKSALTATERHGLEIFSRPCKTPRPRMNAGFAALQQGRRSLTIGLSASDSWEFYRWPTPRTPTSSGSPWPR
ncbi:cytochrome-c peroxidase [Xanthomonas oryzae]|uniref:cytochrome-c peroxidase n=2 Tax=Xanthomonas oryzae TaxID=347 RepID=UPI0015EEB550|nr:cytochrome-c peroxidase [Xanthomonas oryzae]MDI9069629.1 cytochrome-c peroxidase [Xanthomonas oryzae pv. oryzae]MDI9080046.1 cytochrome-c peroxidase [Xanthomonas oryzae pv. oryzae]MDI9103511.1 cytochrome-c peroxidase [Xanthomonas oryzae pv. oryzae]MDI9912243.1 cytochrome-c peroxidase [Xanthomonas oryzae pv. oryzae]UUF80472.1 cytochrome-c peroxidase [Xanthomonas oryzae pv. oryzae]